MDKLPFYIKKLLPDLVASHARPDRASTEQIPGQAGNDRMVKPGMTWRVGRGRHKISSMSSGDLVMQEEIIYIYMILCYDSRRRCEIIFYNKRNKQFRLCRH